MANKTIQAPIVHLNGSGAQALVNAYAEAGTALRDALAKLAATAPNGRDYYPLGDAALPRAAREHAARVAKIRELLDEVCTLHEAVVDRKAGEVVVEMALA